MESPGIILDNGPAFIWRGICPPKISVFLWQLWKGKVFVKEYVHKCGMGQVVNLECAFCHDDIESIDHLFLHCAWSKAL